MLREHETKTTFACCWNHLGAAVVGFPSAREHNPCLCIRVRVSGNPERSGSSKCCLPEETQESKSAWSLYEVEKRKGCLVFTESGSSAEHCFLDCEKPV